MKKKLIGIIIVLLGLYWGWNRLTSPYGYQVVAYEPSTKECFNEDSYKYCVYRSKQGTDGTIAYHLHGRNLDEHSWNDDTYFTAMIQHYWAENKAKSPIIVSVSFGPIWLLAPKNSTEASGLLEKFRDEVIPKVESRLGKPQHRSVFGESMGGLNALILGLSSAGLFNKVASLCPGIYSSAPFAPLSEIKKLLKRTGADPKIIYGVISLAKKYISNDSEWNKISPLSLIADLPKGKAPTFYLSCGLYDKYGNFEGSKLFVEKARERGLQIEWHPFYGGHCAIDIRSLAEFLLK